MAPKATARSSAARSKASSPPKASRVSKTPVGRETRSTRSRSVDIEGIIAAAPKQRGGKRTDREGSVASVGSNTSASSTGSRARKRTRKPAVNRDLSMVAEDIEHNEEARGFAPSDDEEDALVEDIELHNPGSPTDSQMTGTTAITSHSAFEIEKLDPMMAEVLPQLLEGASKILNHLAPEEALQNEEQVETIVKDLKIPGSRRGKHLRLCEQTFMPTKQLFGGEIYIRTDFVLRKLLNTDSPTDGNFRPDPVIHAANLAILLTEFLVLQQGQDKFKTTLQGVCQTFPKPFTGMFNEAQDGHSDLWDETFALALDFNTQTTMAFLARMGEDGVDLTPDQILASIFYEECDTSDPELLFTEMTEDGVLKNMLHSGPAYSQSQIEMVQERVALINGTFRHSEEAREAGDLVDFEQLNEMFPWMTFITNLVQWSRRRFNEISESISKQGGIDEITKSLIEMVKTNDSQADIRFDPQPKIIRDKKRELLPAADITQPNQSFLSPSSIHALQKLKGKTGTSSSITSRPISHAPSSRAQPRSKQASSAPIPVSAQQVAEPVQQNEDDFQPIIDDGTDDLENRPRSTAEYTAAWNENSREKNKENRKPTAKPAARPRLIDRQPNATKVVWDESQEDIAEPSARKRTQAESEASDESEDQGFQEDQRQFDPNRRVVAPPGPRLSPVQDSSPPHKRQRVREQVSPRVESSRAGAQRRPERELQSPTPDADSTCPNSSTNQYRRPFRQSHS